MPHAIELKDGKILTLFGIRDLLDAVQDYLLFADNEPSAEVYGAAADRQQASIVFDVANQMVQMTPALMKRCKIMAATKRIVNYSNAGFYQVLSAEVGTKHGLNVSGLVLDEVHAQPNRKLYGGLDLSSTGDITAFVLMFPPRTPEEKYIMLPFFWIPEDTIPQRVRRASVPYDIWFQQGYLMATEGNVIHYGFIEKVIEELGKTYHILEIAFDRWGAVQMTQNLEGMGFTVVPFGQGFKDMSPPTKEFYKLLMEGRIVHGGNPIMAWMAGNVVVDTDPAGNIKPTKAKSPEKIDGIVAAIMALDRCIRNEGQQQGSIYDERDMIVF